MNISVHIDPRWGILVSLDTETVKISMDRKGRATDNAYIERFFRSIKYEKLYLYEPKDGKELFDMCQSYISFYNNRRGHSSIGDVPTTRVYKTAAQ